MLTFVIDKYKCKNIYAYVNFIVDKSMNTNIKI